ncbi:MAG: class I SAM-dependent methyltransferase, partial [Planctomycetota bacterium]
SRSEVLPPLEPGGFEGPLADRRMAQAARERVEEAFWRLWRESQAAPGWAEPLARAYRLLGATVGHYAASKLRRDPVLAALPELCPGEGKVLQLGCGLGLASARLALYDPRRTIRGLDHDPRKVALARAALGETTGARFELGDAFTAPLGRPEVVLLIDVLHYWPYEEQDRLLARCAEALPAGGRLVLREGTLDAPGHRWVAWGERLALSLGFTRGGAGLFFDTEEGLRARVRRAGFAVRSAHPELGLGSNTVLVCERVARAEFAAGGSP